MEAMNSEVVSLGFVGLSELTTGSGAALLSFFVTANCPYPLPMTEFRRTETYCGIRNIRFQRKPLTDWMALYAKVESLPDATSSPVFDGA